MARSLILALVVLLATVRAVGPASADVLAGPDATKVCAGFEGGGIKWSIQLNEGWRPSRLISYRVILRDPHHRVINASESARLGGGWIGPFPYWDSGTASHAAPATNSLGAPTAGVYTLLLQIRVDPRYPDIDAVGDKNLNWRDQAGRWVTRVWRIRVFPCRAPDPMPELVRSEDR